MAVIKINSPVEIQTNNDGDAGVFIETNQIRTTTGTQGITITDNSISITSDDKSPFSITKNSPSAAIITGVSSISGLQTPTQPTEAANKQYVDDAVAGGGSGGNYLPLAGGTMDNMASIIMNDAGTRATLMGSEVRLNNTETLASNTLTSNSLSIYEPNTDLMANLSTAGLEFSGNATVSGLAVPTANNQAANKQYVDYMKNVFQLGNTYIFGSAGCNLVITLIYPRFDSWTDNSPARFLGNNIINGYAWFDAQVKSATTIDITDIFTNNGFYVRGSSLYITRTQNFPMYSNNGPTNQNAYFNFSLTGSANNLGRITMTAFPQANGHFFFFNFTLPQGIEIGYNE